MSADESIFNAAARITEAMQNACYDIVAIQRERDANPTPTPFQRAVIGGLALIAATTDETGGGAGYTDQQHGRRADDGLARGLRHGCGRSPLRRRRAGADRPGYAVMIRERRCIDCAFHPGSPESAYGSGGCAAEGGSIIQVLQTRLRESGAAATPFYCHENLPNQDSNGDGWRSVKASAKDTPVDQLEVCAGWAAEYRRIVGELS